MIYADPRFWRLAPLSAACIGTAWSLQGLWAAQWLIDVERLDRSGLLWHLLIMAIALSLGGLLWGIAVDRARRRGTGPRTLLGLVATMLIAAQLASIPRLPLPSYVPWIVVAAVGAGTVLSYAILAKYFPKELAGRANAALNVFHIGSAFVVQYMTGLVVQLWPPIAEHYPEVAYQAAFAFNIGLQIVAGIWFVTPNCSPGYPKILAACKMVCLRITESLAIPCHVRDQNTLGPVACVLTVVLITIWVATQWTASRLG
jgi:MFS family permease